MRFANAKERMGVLCLLVLLLTAFGFLGVNGAQAVAAEYPPRLRGATLGTETSTAITDLRSYGANAARVFLMPENIDVDVTNHDAYIRRLRERMESIASLLPTCEQVGMNLIICLGTPPGGRLAAWPYPHRIFSGHPQAAVDQACFFQAWREIASYSRFFNSPAAFGLDLCNEPGGGVNGVRPVLAEAARQVRTIDRNKWLVVEPPFGDPHKLADFQPLRQPRVIYSPHVYEPLEFTHQGLYGYPSGITYPGKIVQQEGSRQVRRNWDRQTLRDRLNAVVSYQQTYDVPIFIGEFSCIVGAPGATQYLSDAISIFEHQRWSWAYHGFREAPVWWAEDPSRIGLLTASWQRNK